MQVATIIGACVGGVMKENKIIAYFYYLYMVLVAIIFEIVMFIFNALNGKVLKCPIEFFLYTMALCIPMCNRIMALIQPAHKNNVLFDIGKYIFDFYFCILFVTTLYNNSVLMTFRWFIYIFSVLNLFCSIKKGDYRNVDYNRNEQYVLSFQLVSITYCIMLIIICNLGMNVLTVFLICIYLIFGNIIRVYALSKLGELGNCKFLVRYIFSALIEACAFCLYIQLLPVADLGELKKLLYDMPVTIYVDIILLTVIFVLFEIPMHTIRNKIWNKFCKHIKVSEH